VNGDKGVVVAEGWYESYLWPTAGFCYFWSIKGKYAITGNF